MGGAAGADVAKWLSLPAFLSGRDSLQLIKVSQTLVSQGFASAKFIHFCKACTYGFTDKICKFLLLRTLHIFAGLEKERVLFPKFNSLEFRSFVKFCKVLQFRFHKIGRL